MSNKSDEIINRLSLIRSKICVLSACPIMSRGRVWSRRLKWSCGGFPYVQSLRESNTSDRDGRPFLSKQKQVVGSPIFLHVSDACERGD